MREKTRTMICRLLPCVNSFQNVVFHWASRQFHHDLLCANQGTTVSSGCFLSHISEAKSGDLSNRTKPLQRIPPVVCTSLDFKKLPEAWRNDSVIKNIGCSCLGPRFGSQAPQGGAPSVTPVPEDSMPSSGFCRYGEHVVQIQTWRWDTQIHKSFFKKRKQKKQLVYSNDSSGGSDVKAVATAKLKTAPVSTTENTGVPQSWTAYILVASWLLTERHTAPPTRAVRHQFLSQRSPEEHWHRLVVHCVLTD